MKILSGLQTYNNEVTALRIDYECMPDEDEEEAMDRMDIEEAEMADQEIEDSQQHESSVNREEEKRFWVNILENW